MHEAREQMPRRSGGEHGTRCGGVHDVTTGEQKAERREDLRSDRSNPAEERSGR
jgi:hypothetical protein